MKPIVHQRNPTRKPVVFHDSADTFQSTRATCRLDDRFGGLFRMFAASAYDQGAASARVADRLTRVTLTHERFATGERRDLHHGGWTSLLETLARVMTR